MINFLSAKGTSAACQAIRRLALELPQYPGLRSHSLVEAEERLRHATWSPFAPEAVVALSFRGAEGRLVISVHGIQTRGKWQKDINAELEKNGFRHEPLDYGCFDVIQLIIPRCRSRKIEWFRKRYERLLAAEKTTPSIIAHSFGTYIVASAIAKYDELRFDRVIFCGSISAEYLIGVPSLNMDR